MLCSYKIMQRHTVGYLPICYHLEPIPTYDAITLIRDMSAKIETRTREGESLTASKQTES